MLASCKRRGERAGSQSRLTLSKDEVVGLDELVKGVLGELVDIRVGGGGIGSQSRHEAAGDALVIHDGPSDGYPRKHKEGLRLETGKGKVNDMGEEGKGGGDVRVEKMEAESFVLVLEDR